MILSPPAIRLITVTAACLRLTAGLGLTSQERPPLLSDDFNLLDSAWTGGEGVAEVKDQTLRLKPGAGKAATMLHTVIAAGDHEFKVKVKLAEAEAGAHAGIVFWAGDSGKYLFMIGANGTTGLVRERNGQWDYPVSFEKNDSAAIRPGEWNELRVVTRGNQAALYANGVAVRYIRSDPQRGNFKAGLFAMSGKDVDATAEFAAFRVSLPPASDLATGDAKVIYADDFTKLRPTWTPRGRAPTLNDGKLRLSANAGYSNRLLYGGDQEPVMDVSVKAELHFNDASDEEHAFMGLQFWMKSPSDYHVIEISSTGKLWIGRVRAGQESELTTSVAQQAADFRPHSLTELRVALRPGQATLFINGTELQTIKDADAPVDAPLGLMVNASDEDGLAASFSDFRITRPQGNAADNTSAVVLRDDFQKPGGGWRGPKEAMSAENGAFVVKTAKGQSLAVLHDGTSLRAADIAAKVRLDGQASSVGGLVFWAKGHGEFHALTMDGQGRVGISRHVRGKWLFPLVSMEVPPLKVRPGEWNDLRVVAVGSVAAVMVNGQPFVRFRGQPPPGEWQAGLFGECGPDSERATATFSEFLVRKPSVKKAPAPLAAGVIFEEDFAIYDPGWSGDEEITFKDHTLAIHGNHTSILSSVLVDDMEASVKVRPAPGASASAGLVFWSKPEGKRPRDYIAFRLHGDGQMSVSSLEDGQWVTIMERQKVPEAHIDPLGWTELRVVAKGNKATLHANGVSVEVIEGEAPQGGTLVGLEGTAGPEGKSTATFSSFQLRQP